MGGIRKLGAIALVVAAAAGLAMTLGPAAAAAKRTRPSIRVLTPVVTIAGTPGKVRGRITRGAGITRVQLERQRPPRKSWTAIASAGVRGGSFVFRVATPRATGALKLRVIAGPASHPAAKSAAFALPYTLTHVLKPSVVISAPAPGQSGKLVVRTKAKPSAKGFIAVGIGKATPDGLLVKVRHVSGKRGHWAVSVVPASLLQVVPRGPKATTPTP